MYTLHTANTPNGQKITIALEEMGLDYRAHLLDLNAGEQSRPEFQRISPNGKIPVLVDEESGVSMFESCAILYHLGATTGKLMPADQAGRETVLQWLFLQAASVGPMLGQLWWFRHAAPENALALERYTRETKRLYGVVERRLMASAYIAGSDYTVADIAFYTWLVSHEELGIALGEYPKVAAWLKKVGARPAVERGLRKTREESHA
jgi:GST-like protein